MKHIYHRREIIKRFITQRNCKNERKTLQFNLGTCSITAQRIYSPINIMIQRYIGGRWISYAIVRMRISCQTRYSWHGNGIIYDIQADHHIPDLTQPWQKRSFSVPQLIITPIKPFGVMSINIEGLPSSKEAVFQIT